MKYLATLAMAAMCCSGIANAQQAPGSNVDTKAQLQSFVSITDGHIRHTLESITAFATTADARSGDWNRIEAPLRSATVSDVPATNFYGLPDGKYYVVGKGVQPVPISDRPYFATVFSGKNAVGDLVIGKSTGKPGAIVAVPVRDAAGKVIGLVGASIDLNELDALIHTELSNGPGTVFWAVDAKGITALHSDPNNILEDAGKLSPELHAAIERMIASPSGVEHYSYKGVARTVDYRHSTLTGWTYGFGVTH